MKYSKFILLFLHKGLFTGKDIVLKKQKIKLRKIKGLKQYHLNDLILIEQNPLKASKWAGMAKRGAEISWLIDKRRNKYLARVMKKKVLFL